ncbi:MAG: hypothetical protein P8Y36_05745, partial [Alphaproteobacteria bacterium]
MKKRTVSTFSPVVLFVSVAIAIGALVLGAYLVTKQKEAHDNFGPNSYSRSIVGHAGIANLLKKIGIPVIQSRSGSLWKSREGVLVLAEPNYRFGETNPLYELMRAKTILFVLPKWKAIKDLKNSGWAERVILYSRFRAKLTLDFVVSKGSIGHVKKVEKWTTNIFKADPKITEPVQLIKSDKLIPLIACDKGILLGALVTDERTIWILSDPDVISNQGFGKAGKSNATLAVKIIQSLRGKNLGKVVFDETIHGYKIRTGSPLRILFEFPFSLIALQAAIAIALLLWATMGRFGAPQKAPPPLSAGKQGLLDNIASLSEFAGHQKLIVQRYVEATIRDTAKQIYAPKGLSDEELAKWVQRVGKARGVTQDNIEILNRANHLLRQGHSDLREFVELAR